MLRRGVIRRAVWCSAIAISALAGLLISAVGPAVSQSSGTTSAGQPAPRTTPSLTVPAVGWQTEINGGKAARRSRGVQSSATRAASEVRATAAELGVDGGRTWFELQLNGHAGANVYTLAHPHRVVIDLGSVAFHLPPQAGRQGRGVVSAFRYGLIAPGHGRVVLDLTRPARVEAADVAAVGSAGGIRLRLLLQLVDEATFVREATTSPTEQAAPSIEAPHEDPPSPSPGQPRKRPVVVIDPGHGGIDPGAIGSTDISEKNIVLAVAKHVRAQLTAQQRYTVVLTRSQDVFVSLDARLALSRRMEADLFVSIHADAVDAKFAQTVRGATIYTLAERASDERARLLAEKENAVDSLAGMAGMPDADRDQVKSILIDLLKRETASLSSEFSNLLSGRLQQALALSREPQRAAAFKVLKQAQSPSVLVELGYMTNPEDEQLMRGNDWQKKVASSIAGAVDTYFSRRTAGRP